MEAIKADAIANGTFLKAPNGKDTNLNEEQWLMVRTSNFKKWFGDWMKAFTTVNVISSTSKVKFNLKQRESVAKKEIVDWARKNGVIKTLSNEESGGKGEIHIAPKSIEKIVDDVYNIKDEYLQQLSLNLLLKLEDLVRESKLGESHVGYKKGKDGIRKPENGLEDGITILRYFGAVDIDGKIYRAKTTIKRTDYKNYQKVYTYEITKIELFDGETAGEKSNSPTSNNSITFANLLKGIESDYKNGEKILNSSKIVDENGEPRVVYHGTDSEFTSFEMQDGSMGRGAYFTSNWDEAAQYAMEKLGVENIDELDESKIKEMFLNIRDEKNITHSRFSRGDIEVLATSPNQIKSATDNNGEFGESGDIRSRTLEERKALRESENTTSEDQIFIYNGLQNDTNKLSL